MFTTEEISIECKSDNESEYDLLEIIENGFIVFRKKDSDTNNGYCPEC
jgi:hypothetical protein